MCTACQKQMNGIGRRKKTMAKKRSKRRGIRGFSTGDIQSVATQTVIPGIIGAIGANYLDKLPFLKDNPQYSNYGGIAIGLLLATMTKNPMIQAAGVGLSIVSGGRVAGDLLDGQAATNGLGRLLPPGTPSVMISGLDDTGVKTM